MEFHEAFGDDVAGDLVGLGHDAHQCGVGARLADGLEDPPVAGADLLVGGHRHGDEVDVGIGFGDHVVEPVADQLARLVQAGGVHHDDLGFLAVHNAAHGVAGGFRLVGGDGDLLAHQRVGQRGLAGVGPAHDGHEAGAVARRGGVVVGIAADSGARQHVVQVSHVSSPRFRVRCRRPPVPGRRAPPRRRAPACGRGGPAPLRR